MKKTTKLQAGLFDLTFAGYPISGIPNEVGLLFEMFALQDEVHFDAVIHQARSARRQALTSNRAIADVATIISRFAEVKARESSRLLRAFEMLAYATGARLPIIRSLFSRALIEVEGESLDLLFDSIYRVFFARIVSPGSREALKRRRYIFSACHNDLAMLRGELGAAPEEFRIPSRYQVAISYGQKNIRFVGAAKVVHRHVDLIGLSEPDTLGNTNIIFNTLNYVRRVVSHSDHVVCVSNVEKKKLLELAPNLVTRVSVIPAVIPQYGSRQASPEFLRSIFTSYNWAARDKDASSVIQNISNVFSANVAPEYLVCVSTIEPRKNYAALIRAWEYLRFALGRDVKLVTIGGLGWQTEKLEPLFARYAKQGEIIPLRDVPKIPFEAILSNASLFLFLSHAEGFDVGPLEALQCGCRCLVLDKPIYREVYGDGVDYIDDDDAEKVATTVLRMLEERKRDPDKYYSFRGAANLVLAQYTPSAVRRQWLSLLGDVCK